MPRSAQANQRIRDERREQILQAGLTVFAAKGLAATKISDIAAAADLSYGLVYHYFHDKDELYFALVERALQGTLHLTTTALQRPGAAWGRLRALCEEMIEGARAAPEYFLIILQAQVSEPPSSAIHTLAQRYGEQIWTNLVTLIEQAQEEGQAVLIDARELASTMIAILQGLSLNQMLNHQTRNVSPSVSTVLRFLRPSIPREES
jgi:AcrR family transcriptional regulator